MKKVLIVLLFLFVVGCRGAGYEELFDEGNAWPLADQEGVSSEVVNEAYHLTIDFPDSQFWTTAGRRDFDNGVFEVDVQPVSGSAESAYGLVVRASPNAEDFYFFLISADGFYSIGGCRSSCENNNFIRLADNMWTQSDLIRTGLNETHTLSVTANGAELSFAIDGTELAAFNNSSLGQGDIGIFMQTFDSAATVSFDNLRFTPSESN